MVVLAKRYCVQYFDGTIECFRDGFWYSDTGIIVKWSILAGFFLFFTAWFLGGYLHAKARLRKGKPLLSYHRWLVSYQDRKRYGQTMQNQYSYYAHQPYTQGSQQQQQGFGSRPQGAWSEPPPMYNGDAPPGYAPPVGASKMDPNQAPGNVEMGQYPPPPPPGAAGEDGSQQGMPPRPPQARLANLLGRFRK